MVFTKLYVWQTERESRWMHSALLHYWTSVWLFSFSAPIKTDDSHFEAVAAGGWGEKERKRNAQRQKRRTVWKQKLQCRLNVFCECVVVVGAQSDFNKGIVIRLCVDVSTESR